MSAPARLFHVPGKKSDEWYTPPWLFEQLGIEFDLDPASPPEPLPWIPARRALTAAEDGLASDWGGALVWLNPPYSDIERWSARMAEHGNGLMLVFARTETRWFQRAARAADLVCFLARRVRFIDHELKTRSGIAPSALVAYGRAGARALHRASLGLELHGAPGVA